MSYYDIFKTVKGNRDSVFEFSLELFNKKPINVLEIGVARSLELSARKSDGWSSMHFASYISEHGGFLDLVDISKESIDNCSKLMNAIPNFSSYQTHVYDGKSFVSENKKQYDLVLLDGSDDPNEMLQCFGLIKPYAKYILCDDYHVKGLLLKQAYPMCIVFKWENNPHELALYGNGLGKQTKLMPLLE